MVGSFKVRLSIPRQELQMIAFEVKDMSCGHCVNTITKAVKQMDAAAQVAVDLAARRVEISSSVDEAALLSAIQEAGYSPMPAAAAVHVAPRRAGGCCCGGR
jgi:copper chaperone